MQAGHSFYKCTPLASAGVRSKLIPNSYLYWRAHARFLQLSAPTMIRLPLWVSDPTYAFILGHCYREKVDKCRQGTLVTAAHHSRAQACDSNSHLLWRAHEPYCNFGSPSIPRMLPLRVSDYTYAFSSDSILREKTTR